MEYTGHTAAYSPPVTPPKRKPKIRMKSTRLLAFLAIAVGALILSCTGGESPTRNHAPAAALVGLSAVFPPQVVDAEVAAVDRIRVSVLRFDNRAPLAFVVLDVDPSDNEWVVELEVDIPVDDPRVLVLVELISLTGAVEAVDWSGITDPLTLNPGRTVDVGQVTVFRGPPDNLAVTSLAIVQPGALLEGTDLQLTADVQTEPTGGHPVLQWASADPTIATVTPEGFLTALSPGTARISAVAGSHDDEIGITVLSRATGLRFATHPGDTDVGRPLDPAPSVQVVDARGGRVAHMNTPVSLALEEISSVGEPGQSGGLQTVAGLGGSTTVAAQQGLATFQDLFVDGAGLFRLIATAVGLPSAASGEFLVQLLEADIEVLKETNRAVSTEGGEVRFRVFVTNLGPHPARDVVVRDQLPSAFHLVSTEVSQGLYQANTGRWQVGNLAVGEFAVLEMETVVADDTQGTTLVNTARADVLVFQADDPSNNEASASVEIGVRNVDIEIFKEVDLSSARPGDEVRYVVTVVNHGPDEAIGIVVDEDLPEGLVVEVDAGSLDRERRVWRLESLAPGEEARLRVRTRVDLDAVTGEVLTNTVRVRTLDGQQDDPSNNEATAVIEVNPRRADIEIFKEADLSSARPGGEVVYTITLVNHGPDEALNLLVEEDLPSQLDLGTADPDVGSFDPESREWRIESLALGETVQLRVRTRLQAETSVGDALVNRVRVRSPEGLEDDPSNNEASASIDVDLATPSADLSVLKEVDRSSAAIGETVTYRITVTNHGPAASTGAEGFEIRPKGVFP